MRCGILGRGGSSKVFRVLTERNDVLALKRVDTRNDSESRSSFINEITLLRKLAGKPEIIQLVDSEIQGRHVIMVSARSICGGGESLLTIPAAVCSGYGSRRDGPQHAAWHLRRQAYQSQLYPLYLGAGATAFCVLANCLKLTPSPCRCCRPSKSFMTRQSSTAI